MKLCASTSWFANMSLEEVLEYLATLDVHCVELTTGAFLSESHCKPSELLKDAGKLKAFRDLLKKYGAEITNFKSHGNVLHPIKEQAAHYRQVFEDSIRLAELLGVPSVANFSGCPGDSENAVCPNWVVTHYPDYFAKLYQWQWNEVVIPYWQTTAKFAANHGVKVAIEMHPGFNVYNPESFLKLRRAAGDNICCCFDPAHLFWQDIDPRLAIRELADAICHVHAKDSSEEMINIRRNGRIDPKPLNDRANRAWLYRTVGHGHDALMWKEIMSMLVLVGYDGVVSLEQDDSFMTATEGFEKSIAFLRSIVIFEKSKGLWWDRH